MERAIRSATALIVLMLAACDNVSWGGADMAVVHPPPKASAPEVGEGEGDDAEGVAPARLPTGPLLFYVVRGPEGATMIPVGEISGDTLLPLQPGEDAETFGTRLVAEQMRQGSEFALFRRGARVGTFVLGGADVLAAGSCTLPTARGSLELTAGADSISEFLAIARGHAPQVQRRVEENLVPSGNMRTLAPIIAERMLRARRAGLPGNWQRAMAQLQPFPVSGSSGPGYAATLLVGDTLGPGLDSEGYSLFYIGVPAQQMGYDSVYVEFSDYPSTGKRAPRVVDYLDWDRDGQVELLLSVFGVNDTWFEAVGRSAEGNWGKIFRESCQRPAGALPRPQEEAADTLQGSRPTGGEDGPVGRPVTGG